MGQAPTPGALTPLAQAVEGHRGFSRQRVPEEGTRGSRGSFLFGHTDQALASLPLWSKTDTGLCSANDKQTCN